MTYFRNIEATKRAIRWAEKHGVGSRIVPDPDAKQDFCIHPQHEPPRHIVIPHGSKLVHTCPACGQTVTIRPNVVRMSA